MNSLLSLSSSLEASLVGAREEAPPLADFWIGIFQVDQVCWIYTLSQKDFKVWTTSLIPEFCKVGSAFQVKRILKSDHPQVIIYQVIKISRLSWNLFCQAIKTSSLSLECLCQVSSSWLWKCQVIWEIGTSLFSRISFKFCISRFLSRMVQVWVESFCLFSQKCLSIWLFRIACIFERKCWCSYLVSHLCEAEEDQVVVSMLWF